MRVWAFGDPLASGVWGIREPKPEALQVEPGHPARSAARLRSRREYRLGYGGGYYTILTLARNSAPAKP